MYAGIEYRWKKVVENACLLFYVLTKTTMIQTKEEETREAKIRAEIEELTRAIIQEDWIIENIQKKINRLPISRIKDLKWMVAERIEHEHKRKFLDTQRNDKINLLNSIM